MILVKAPASDIIGEHSQDRPNTPVHDLPQAAIPVHKLLSAVFILLTGFTSASLGMMTLAQQTGALIDPFAAYADILPGQPANAIEGRGFRCHAYAHNYYEFEGYIVCSLDLPDGISSRIGVGIFNDVIQQTDFVVRDDSLRLGDLALLMGAPSGRDLRSIVGFSWRSKYVLADVDGGQSSLFRPVWTVTFTNLS